MPSHEVWENVSSNSTNGLAKATSPLLLSWRYYVILVSKKVSFSHGGIALFSCLKSHFLFNSGLPHIWTGVALLFGSSQSRLSEGTSSYLILWIRCFNGPEQKRLLKFLQFFFIWSRSDIRLTSILFSVPASLLLLSRFKEKEKDDEQKLSISSGRYIQKYLTNGWKLSPFAQNGLGSPCIGRTAFR